MKMKALTLVLIGALGLSWMAQAELVTTQSKPSIQASLKALHGSNLDVSVFDQLMTTHLQDVAAGKVHGNQSILDISLHSLEDSSAKSRFAALRQPNLLNATTATAVQLKLPTLKLVKKTVAGTSIDSVDAETFNTLAKFVSQTQDIANWAGSDAKKHQQSVYNILQEVWLKSVDKWDSDIAKGKLNPSFYPDLIALVNHATSHNQVPSIETFRQLLDASIVLARGQNYPDTAFGKKLYQKSFRNITQALATYLALTSTTEEVKASQFALVHMTIGELKYTLPVYIGKVNSTINRKSTNTPSLLIKKISQEHDEYLANFNLQKNEADLDKKSVELDKELAELDAKLAQTDAKLAQTDAKLAQTDAELEAAKDSLAQTEAKLAQTKKEGAFIKEAQYVQKDLWKNLQEYLVTKDETKLENIRKLYMQLQDLNQRAKTEYSNDEVKQVLITLQKLVEVKLKDKLNKP